MSVDASTAVVLTPSQAKELVNLNVPICLPVLEVLSEDVAKIFSRSEFRIQLNSLPVITLSAAEALVEHRGPLELLGLTSVSSVVGDALALHEGPLRVSEKLTSLSSHRLAARIARVADKVVRLDNLLELSPEVASGLGVSGVDKKRYKDSLEVKGRDADGFDINGYDRSGFDRYGYDKEGFDWDGYNKQGYDRQGYDREGDYRITLSSEEESDENAYEEEVSAAREFEIEEDEVRFETGNGPLSISLNGLQFLSAEVAAELVDGFGRIVLHGISDGSCRLGKNADRVLASGCRPGAGTILEVGNHFQYLCSIVKSSHADDLKVAMWAGVMESIDFDNDTPAYVDIGSLTDQQARSLLACVSGSDSFGNNQLAVELGSDVDEMSVEGTSVLFDIAGYLKQMIIKPKRLDDPNILEICLKCFSIDDVSDRRKADIELKFFFNLPKRMAFLFQLHNSAYLVVCE